MLSLTMYSSLRDVANQFNAKDISLFHIFYYFDLVCGLFCCMGVNMNRVRTIALPKTLIITHVLGILVLKCQNNKDTEKISYNFL